MSKKIKVVNMTNNEVFKAAVDYVARHKHDYCQIYTCPECKMFKDENGTIHCQIWVMLPEKLEKADW